MDSNSGSKHRTGRLVGVQTSANLLSYLLRLCYLFKGPTPDRQYAYLIYDVPQASGKVGAWLEYTFRIFRNKERVLTAPTIQATMMDPDNPTQDWALCSYRPYRSNLAIQTDQANGLNSCAWPKKFSWWICTLFERKRGIPNGLSRGQHTVIRKTWILSGSSKGAERWLWLKEANFFSRIETSSLIRGLVQLMIILLFYKMNCSIISTTHFNM